MNVLQEILAWSADRPAWQRDALRRLVQNGQLLDDDIRELTEACKGAHGLADQPDLLALAKEHLPDASTSVAAVSLVSIFHHRGVNALAESQTLKFGPWLTVVYGDNAAGKTGYIRILKGACRARAQERIIGNVVSGAAPLSPAVSIKYRVGAETTPREWTGDREDEFISRVSVFDTQSAAVYLTEKTDVAFRPFGLDLFDKLVRACKSVRVTLESGQRSLAASALPSVQAQIPATTSAGRLLSSVSSLTDPAAVEKLAQLSVEDEARLALIEKSLADLQANDPEKLIRQLSVAVGRVRSLARHLRQVEAALSEAAVAAVFGVRAFGRRKSEEARRLRELAFPTGLLSGTGTESWTALWEAARSFSHEHAYPGESHPVVRDGALCVLCQQAIGHDAGLRLEQFEGFVSSTTEQELRGAREDFARLRLGLLDLATSTDATAETLREIRIENEPLADAIAAACARNEDRRMAIMRALAEDVDLPTDCPAMELVSDQVQELARQIESRIETIRAGDVGAARSGLVAEKEELAARKMLAVHKQTVLDDIERRKRYAAYGLCLEETRTQAITQKSTTMTRVAVTQRLRQRFRDELENLSFHHIEVDIQEAGGAEGVLYHKLVLTRAPGVELPRVVSEGEQRCLSIASFFAELSAAEDPSGIVFDDPVSSLDYRWREGVARRLVLEARTRQVIVFTHDVVFLLFLKQFAEESGVEQCDQHVRNLPMGAGVCADELPWVALPVKKKIGYLKSEWQAVDKLFRDGQQTTYEREAQFLYGLLREAWERALEEVLLGGVVERYRPGVQTQQLGAIADVSREDCRVLDAAMTKSSRWLPGHDQAPAARAPVPEPAELKSDIETLEQWVAAIRKRRS